MKDILLNEKKIFEGKKLCFFSTVPEEKLKFENYSIQDLRILSELGFEVIIANKFSKIPWDCDLYFSWWASGSFFPLIKALCKRKPIITIAGGNEAMLYSDSLTKENAGFLNYPIWKKALIKFTLKFSDCVIIVSNFMKKDVIKLGAKNPILVYNCVDTSIFFPKNEEKKYITSIFKLDKNTVLLKRGEIFIRAIYEVTKKYPNQIYVIIGKKGDDYERINKIVSELGLNDNIIFTGEIINEEVLNWIQKSKLYVQISDTETFGLAIAEAMSCSVPVLVSSRGAIPEIVDDYGIYVNHNSVESVSSGLLEFLSKNETEISNLANNSRKRIIENFSYEKRKLKLTEIIENILINN
jgi:glycosyltransferase involved in cell wall biosynthesis